jgi:hypothetical protein
MAFTYKQLPLTVVLVGALLSIALSSLVPLWSSNSQANGQPPFNLLLGVGLGIILLTAGILAAALKLGLPLRRSTIGLVLIFNILIIITKFVVAPLALYKTNVSQSFLDSSFVVTAGGYWIVAAATFLLYALVLSLIFRLGGGQFGGQLPKKHIAWKIILGLVIIGAVVFGIGGIVGILVLLPVFLPVSALIDYLGKIGSGLVVILLLLLGAIAVAAYAVRQAAGEAKLLRDASVMAGLFWLCLSLLLLYHVLWVVFMGALVTIWPFKTFSPNGK